MRTGRHALAQLDLASQLDQFDAMVRSNGYVATLLTRLADLDLPGWYLTAGCLFQTVWNVLTGRESTAGINDYDVFYFDATDLSWEAEDAAIRRCAEAVKDLPIKVEVRNQARVHLWYPEKFGIPCPAFESTEDGIDSFMFSACCVAIRLGADGRSEIYAPFGFGDLFSLVVRPISARGVRDVHEAKIARWLSEWPHLRVLTWRDTGPA